MSVIDLGLRENNILYQCRPALPPPRMDVSVHQKGDDWASFMVADGKLVTGQNPASSEAVAHKLLSFM